MKKFIFIIGIIILSGLSSVFSQYPPNYQYSLLNQDIVDELIARSSGELAMRHIIELAGYSRPRKSDEFKDALPESDYIIKQLMQYGISNASIERFGKVSTWRGLSGSLIEVSPGLSKIADFNDLPLMLASGSQPSDIKAQLVWVDDGSVNYLSEENVKGKIVLTSANIRSVHAMAMMNGALGTVSFYSPRPLIDPLQIPSSRISGNGFGFILPPREAHILRDRLIRGEKIIVHARVESKYEELDLQVPTCVIEGTDIDADEIILTAHLFEGYVKMGANDNLSGCAVLLEVVNILNQLIDEGKIERPKRNLRFLWVPEFSGTIPWVNAHANIIDKTLLNLNLDMVGLNLRNSRSFLCLHKSGYSTASYVNDVVENFFRYVGETNMQGITDGLGRRGFSNRIISPTGSDDPFYYRIMTLHGSSDHAVFNDANIGVPGLKMITWPDEYYHTSGDRPDKCDPTQLRRIIFITAASTYTIAAADNAMAARIASGNAGMSSHRMGIQLSKAVDQLSRTDKNNYSSVYKRAVFNLEGVALGEEASLMKLEELMTDKTSLVFLTEQRQNLKNISASHLLSLEQYMKERGRELDLEPVEIKLSDMELEASSLRTSHTKMIRNSGYGSVRGVIRSLPQEFLADRKYSNIVNTNEVVGLAKGGYSILEIKKMVDAQFEQESPLDEIINYLEILKEAGYITF